ncbi:MAG: AraC family transcriptional regulator [Pseudomonadota bacterium]
MDPLSDIVSLLRPHDCVAAGLDAGGDWSIRFDRHAGLKCNAVLKGTCWLRVEGAAEPRRLTAGDCVILPKGRPFLLSSRPARFSEDAEAIYAPIPHGGTAVYGGGGDFFMTGSRFLLSGAAADILLRALPLVVVVRPGAEREAVQWSLHRIAEELREPRPGAALSIAHLSHFVLVQAMRCHLEEAPPKTGGWLAAIADRQISRAVTAMHDDPARAWTVRELAARAGLSRTSFAVRFRRIAGQTPMGYLTQWRMLFAAERLRRMEASVAEIAAEVGYASESAFTVAFKRATGQTPRRYARRAAADVQLSA